MMKNRFFLCVLMTILFSLPGFAQKVTLDYLDGILEVKTENQWLEAVIGQSFPENAVLKLAENTLAELSYNKMRITLSQAGIFSLADILKKSGKNASAGVGTLIGGKLQTMVAGARGDTGSAVMGVRGAAAAQPEKVEWALEDEETLKAGRKLLQEKRYAEAEQYFRDQARLVTGEEQGPYLFFAGYASAMQGNKAAALKYLLDVEADPRMPFFPELVLLKGQLLLESLSYRKALELFDFYLKEMPYSDSAQAVYLQSAFCLEGLENKSGALERLERAKLLNPDSDLGIAAAQKIKDLKGQK